MWRNRVEHIWIRCSSVPESNDQIEEPVSKNTDTSVDVPPDQSNDTSTGLPSALVKSL